MDVDNIVHLLARENYNSVIILLIDVKIRHNGYFDILILTENRLIYYRITSTIIINTLNLMAWFHECISIMILSQYVTINTLQLNPIALNQHTSKNNSFKTIRT